MGLKAGLQLLQEAGKVATKYTDNVVGGIGIRNLTKPISLEGLRLAPEAIGDTVKFSQNNYLQNIKKIGLNQEDRNLLETLLSKSKYSEYLQEMFNEVMSRKDLNISELRELLTGKYVDHFFFGDKIYINQALMEKYFETIMKRLKTLQPNDLKIIKRSEEECLNFFLQKNKLGDFIFSDDLFKKISKIEQLDDFFISNIYSPVVDKRIITGLIGKQKIFTYDSQEGLFKFFDDISPTKRITTTRYLDGNEIKTLRDTAISKNKEVLLEEIRCIKNSSGETTESIKYIKSDIDGAFNVTKTDLKTGKKNHCSKAYIDKNGNKKIQQSLVSPLGTKTNINYLEAPNGNIEYSYKSFDSQGSLLTENIRTRTILNDSEILYNINGHSLNVKFQGTDKIEIFDNVTRQKNIIDLKELLKDVAIEDRQKMILMLKKVPADELLALNKNGVKQILSMDIDASSTFLESDLLISSPNLFVFLHELGHKKDMVKLKFSSVERDCFNTYHVFMAKGKSSFANDTPFSYISQEETEKIASIADTLTKLENLSGKSKISSNSDLLRIYNKERTAYINRFGKEDRRIDYFIEQGSGLGCEGEAIAEINALLSTPIGERALGLRSYLLAENFPETIAYAQKLLLN